LRIQVSDRALKQIKKIPPPHKKQLTEAIDSLSDDPCRGSQLTGKLADYRSLRIGDYRIIYTITDDMIKIVVLGHRSHIYEIIRRLLNFLFGI